MSSPRTSRLRAALILVVAVFVWSDAALASFVCPHMSGCEHDMPMPAATENSGAAAMPCCPVKPEVSMECDASAMECCTWHHSDTDVTALLFASDQPQPKHFVAVLPAAVANQLPSLARAHVFSPLDDLPYVKPVTQKKTDLRI
jgi:hypothetical protein